MKKRYLISAGIMAACAGIGLGLLAMLPPGQPTPGITKANFDRVETGMTEQEVETKFGKLGGHGGDYVGGMTWTMYTKSWRAVDGSTAAIQFSHNHRLWHDGATPSKVYAKKWQESSETVLDKIRRWLRI